MVPPVQASTDSDPDDGSATAMQWTPFNLAAAAAAMRPADTSDDDDAPPKKSRMVNPNVQGRVVPTTFQTASGPRTENVCVLFNAERIAITSAKPVKIMAAERDAVLVEVLNKETGARYSVLTAHAPYQEASGIAGIYFTKLREIAAQMGVDLIMGDLNTYSKPRSGGRGDKGFTLLDVGGTSRARSPLDKLFVNEATKDKVRDFGNAEDKTPHVGPDDTNIVSWNMQGKAVYNQGRLTTWMSENDCDVLLCLEPSSNLAQDISGERAPSSMSSRPRREAVAQSDKKRMRDNYPDHHPIYVVLREGEGLAADALVPHMSEAEFQAEEDMLRETIEDVPTDVGPTFAHYELSAQQAATLQGLGLQTTGTLPLGNCMYSSVLESLGLDAGTSVLEERQAVAQFAQANGADGAVVQDLLVPFTFNGPSGDQALALLAQMHNVGITAIGPNGQLYQVAAAPLGAQTIHLVYVNGAHPHYYGTLPTG